MELKERGVLDPRFREDDSRESVERICPTFPRMAYQPRPSASTQDAVSGGRPNPNRSAMLHKTPAGQAE